MQKFILLTHKVYSIKIRIPNSISLFPCQTLNALCLHIIQILKVDFMEIKQAQLLSIVEKLLVIISKIYGKEKVKKLLAGRIIIFYYIKGRRSSMVTH